MKPSARLISHTVDWVLEPMSHVCLPSFLCCYVRPPGSTVLLCYFVLWCRGACLMVSDEKPMRCPGVVSCNTHASLCFASILFVLLHSRALCFNHTYAGSDMRSLLALWSLMRTHIIFLAGRVPAQQSVSNILQQSIFDWLPQARIASAWIRQALASTCRPCICLRILRSQI
jgi:hypothetical protein